MPEIKLRNIVKRWNKFYAVDHLDLDIEDNAFITLLGPSGCGKTTTLRMIAGLETPTSGQIMIGDKVVFDSEAGINVPANKRKVGFLFQNYALWPNMTVYQNIAFGLENIKDDLPEYDFEVKKLRSILAALDKPKELIGIIEECRDKRGKLDTNRVYMKFIDAYTISMQTAKELYGYKLQEEADPVKAASDIKEKLEEQIEKAISTHKAKGEDLDEESRILKNGKIVTKERRLTKEEIDLSVRRVSRIVKIGMFMDRYPSELSGGQQQRVAIARTLAPEPQVLFMDEPLSNLDAKLRLEMRYELQRLHLETGSTFVYVTHDQMEAMTLATKICLINNGVLQQYDAPLDVYNKPNNLFVADFVGNPSINFIDAKGTEVGGELKLTMLDGIKATFRSKDGASITKWQQDRDLQEQEAQKEKAALLSDKKYIEKGNKDEVFKYNISRIDDSEYVLEKEPVITDEDFVIAVRPENINLEENGGIEAEIYGAMPTGMEATIKVAIGNFLLTSVVFGNSVFKIGEKKHVGFKGDQILLFDRKTGKYITSGTLVTE